MTASSSRIASRIAIARRGSPPAVTPTVTGPSRAVAGVHAVAACRSSARTQKTRWAAQAALTRGRRVGVVHRDVGQPGSIHIGLREAPLHPL